MAIFPANRNNLNVNYRFNRPRIGTPVHNKYEQNYSSSNIANLKHDIERFQRICTENPNNEQAKKLLKMFQDLLASIGKHKR